MNIRTKSTIVLIGVLLIGIIIGALGSTMLRRNMWEDRVAKFRSPHGFTERFIKIIQPDPQQEKAIEEILLKHHHKMLSITEKSRDKINTHADSLFIELEPILSSEQMQRAKKVLRRGPPHFRDRRDHLEQKEKEK